jgi:phage terminase small subunit
MRAGVVLIDLAAAAKPVIMKREYLTAKQEKFAQNYAKTRNGAASYRHGYDADGMTDQQCAVEASELLRNPNVADRINEIIACASLVEQFGIAECFKMWMDIATADPHELIGLKIGCCRYCHGYQHGYQWREREYFEALRETDRANKFSKPEMQLPPPDLAGGFGFNHTLPPVDDCPECRGEGIERVVPRDTSKLSPQARLLYGGLKKKKDGLEIIIADQNKARENASRMLGAFKDSVRLDGSMSMMAAYVDMKDVDAVKAAEIYQQMIKGPLRGATTPRGVPED